MQGVLKRLHLGPERGVGRSFWRRTRRDRRVVQDKIFSSPLTPVSTTWSLAVRPYIFSIVQCFAELHAGDAASGCSGGKLFWQRRAERRLGCHAEIGVASADSTSTLGLVDGVGLVELRETSSP